MGDWPRLVNLRRCARGYIEDLGEATNTTVALTNDSTGAELLLVWQFINGFNFSSTEAFSYQQIPIMGARGTVQALVPGDAPPPGALSAGDQPIRFPFDWQPDTNEDPYYWPATFPFAVLLPGWSLVCQQSNIPTDSIALSFFWEAILPKYFDRMYTHQYLELALMAQGG